MILYNVTIKIDHSTHEAWLQWMQDIHIPAVMDTGLFTESKMSRLLGVDESDGFTYSIQYLSPSMESFQNYQQLHSFRLRRDLEERFGDKALTFRTIMRVVFQTK